MEQQSFIAYIENSIKKNWDLDALTDYKGATLQYKDVARKIEKLHIIFESCGIQKGDKIAIYETGEKIYAPFDGFIIMPNHEEKMNT